MNMVVEIGRMLELGKRQEKLLWGETTISKDKGKWNADNKKDKPKTEDKKSGPDLRDIKEGETFQWPAFRKQKSASTKWEWNKMMGDIPQEIINTRKKNGVC